MRHAIEREGQFYSTVPVDPERTSLLWNPRIDEELPELEFLGEHATHHKFGHPMLFKPLHAEVMQSLAGKDVIGAEYYVFTKDAAEISDGQQFHIAKIRLYRARPVHANAQAEGVTGGE